MDRLQFGERLQLILLRDPLAHGRAHRLLPVSDGVLAGFDFGGQGTPVLVVHGTGHNASACSSRSPLGSNIQTLPLHPERTARHARDLGQRAPHVARTGRRPARDVEQLGGVIAQVSHVRDRAGHTLASAARTAPTALARRPSRFRGGRSLSESRPARCLSGIVRPPTRRPIKTVASAE